MYRILVMGLIALFFLGNISAQAASGPKSPVEIEEAKLGRTVVPVGQGMLNPPSASSSAAQGVSGPRSPATLVVEPVKIKTNQPQVEKEKTVSPKEQDKISAVVTAFRQGKISSYYAENQLGSLLKQDIDDQLSKLELEIASLEKKLESFKQAKANPEPWIKKRIDQLLGNTASVQDESMKKSSNTEPL